MRSLVIFVCLATIPMAICRWIYLSGAFEGGEVALAGPDEGTGNAGAVDKTALERVVVGVRLGVVAAQETRVGSLVQG